jgi:hypothetical protein
VIGILRKASRRHGEADAAPHFFHLLTLLKGSFLHPRFAAQHHVVIESVLRGRTAYRR